MKKNGIWAGMMATAFTLVLAGCATTRAVQPAVYYVHAEGSDDNNGRHEQMAFRTLRNAVSKAASDTKPAIIMVIGTLDSKSEGLQTVGSGSSVFYINSNRQTLITIRGKSDAMEDQKAALKSDVDGRRVVEVEGNTNIRFEHIEISGGRSHFAGGGTLPRGNRPQSRPTQL
jgi:hypothetical protein